MSVTADSQGVVQGKFTIPANVLAGAKAVIFNGSGGSSGSASFFGQGDLVQEARQSITTITQRFFPVDPLAQTFSLPTLTQLGGADIFVTAKGSSDIILQIRETQVGLPTSSVIAECRLKPAAINVNNWNRFSFELPITIQANIEYAIVVLCNDAVSSVAVAELGKYDETNSRWVTNQPYQVGVLLSSSNASTWTPHQDRDLTFRLLAAKYNQTERIIDLGTVSVTNATDLIVLAVTDNPTTSATSDILLTLPDSSVISTGDSQVIRLAAGITGDVGVKARLKANSQASAMIAPGAQIISGTLSNSADYVSRAMPADAAGSNVKIIIDALIPSGASVAVQISGTDPGDTWVPVPSYGSPIPLGDDWFEFQFYITGTNEANLRTKLTLNGNAASRPFVKNLRVSVT
jgi:hypothetical protein